MDQPPEPTKRVQISKPVFDGLEVIRRSGLTNMLDRPTVLHLAREWDLTDTADWIERVDTGTYGRLILQGPDVIETDPPTQTKRHAVNDQGIENGQAHKVDENEETAVTDEIDLNEMAFNHVRGTMDDLITHLGKQAILTIADTYETERMGVLVDPSRNNLIDAERLALIRNIGHASSVWLELERALTEVERGIGSLRYLTDPENS